MASIARQHYTFDYIRREFLWRSVRFVGFSMVNPVRKNDQMVASSAPHSGSREQGIITSFVFNGPFLRRLIFLISNYFNFDKVLAQPNTGKKKKKKKKKKQKKTKASGPSIYSEEGQTTFHGQTDGKADSAARPFRGAKTRLWGLRSRPRLGEVRNRS